MHYTELITIEPGKRSGQPFIRGLRMTVRDVLGYLAAGMTVDEILADFPDLTAEDILGVSGVRGRPRGSALGGVGRMKLRVASTRTSRLGW